MATTKKIHQLIAPPEVKAHPSKPSKKFGLSKSDPDYYSKIGVISAQKRKISSEQFSEWAKLSHPRKRKKRVVKK